MVTLILSAVIPNSHRASIISNALFIIVAESTEILGPIFQVGCFKAISGVTNLSCSREYPRNGPPLAVRMMRRRSSRLPVCRHWNIALCSLSTGIIIAPRLAGTFHNQGTGHDQRLFIRQGQTLSSVHRRPGCRKSCGADHRRYHRVDFRTLNQRGNGFQSLVPAGFRDSSGSHRRHGNVLSPDHGPLWSELRHLLAQSFHAAIRNQTGRAQPLRMKPDHIKATCTDGSGGPKNGYRLRLKQRE
jgi:hypothetical protein